MAINNFAVTIGYDREPNIISGDTWDDTLEYDRLLKAKRELDLIAEYNYLMCFQWLHPLKDNWGRSAFLDFKDVGDDDPEKLKLYNLVEKSSKFPLIILIWFTKFIFESLNNHLIINGYDKNTVIKVKNIF